MPLCSVKRQGGDGTETGWFGRVDVGRDGVATAPRAGVVRRDDRGLVPPAFGPAPVGDDHAPTGQGGAPFAEFTGAWPWEWRAGQLDSWVAQGRWAQSTVRNYEGSLALFLAYLCDPHYGWAEQCERLVGTVPTQICHDYNTAVHVDENEGRPERRPLTRAELQALFDTADAAVEEAAGSPRKGWLAAFRDATLFKVDLCLGPAAPRGGDAGRG